MNRSPDKFEALPDERKKALVCACVQSFAQHDYRRAGTEDIARKAGMSKGLLFFYFKNKQALFDYTLRHVADRAMDAIVDDAFWRIDDFFEILLYATEGKRALCTGHPLLLDFSVRVYCSSESAVKNVVDRILEEQMDLLFSRYFKHVRWDKFRDDVDPRDIVNMLLWLVDGYLHREAPAEGRIDADKMFDEFEKWCALVRKVSYRPEFL